MIVKTYSIEIPKVSYATTLPFLSIISFYVASVVGVRNDMLCHIPCVIFLVGSGVVNGISVPITFNYSVLIHNAVRFRRYNQGTRFRLSPANPFLPYKLAHE